LRTPFRRVSKSLIAGVAAGALAISGLTVALTASPAAAATTARIGGANRYDTARLAALATFPGGAATAVLATGQNFPDALAASTLAGALGAPILLTPTANVAPETVAALATLHVHTVQIVGGPAAVSPAVIAQLTGLGYSVPTAIAGATRYDTAAAIAAAAATSAPVGTIGGKKTAIVATGENFPDALAAGSASYFAHFPVLLTATAALSSQASAAITTLGITNVLIAGGPAAVSAGVETSLKALAGGALTTTRLAGATRFETAVAWATNDTAPVISGGLGMSAANVILASGLNFPDALVGAEFNWPILLTPGTLPPSVATFLGANAAAITKITALGGTAAVSDAALAAAGAATAPSGGTATLAGASGNNFFTVTFSAPVNTPTSDNFARNNTALAAGGLVNNLGNNTYQVILPGGVILGPGDVVGTNNANPPTALNTTNAVSPATLTIGANAAPTIMATLFFSAGHAVSVQFSKTVNPATVAGNVKVNGTSLGGITNMSVDETTFTWQFAGAVPGGTGAGGVIGGTDVLTVIGGVTGTPPVPAGVADRLPAPATAPLAATASINASSNTVKPAPLAAKTAVTGKTQGTVFIPSGPDIVSITAKKGTGADGANGPLFQVATAAGTAGHAAAITVSTNSGTGVTTFSITWGAGVYADGPSLAAALNASAPFNTLLVANGVGPVDPGDSVIAGAAPLVGGSTSYAVSVAWSKPVVPTGALGNVQDTTGAYHFTTVGGAAAPSAVLPNGEQVGPAQVGQTLADVLIYTAGPSATSQLFQLVPGTTTLTVTGQVQDFAGNNMTSPTTITTS
jgi:putative cell wall-binding protein